MFGLGTTELVIIMVIVLVVFGGAKLRSLGSDLGGAISEFKSSVKDKDKDKEEEKSSAAKSDAPKDEDEDEPKD